MYYGSPYAAAPYLTSISPSSIQQGATNILITVRGSDLGPAPSVKIGSTSAYVGNSSTTYVMFTVPSSVQAGSYDVRVYNGNMKSSNGMTLTVTPAVPTSLPVPTSISPSTASRGGTATIYGSNFGSAPTVQIGWQAGTYTVSEYTSRNSSSVTFRIPSTVPNGASPVYVLNGSRKSNQYVTLNIGEAPTTPTPVITSINPTTALIGGYATVYGSNFGSNAVVRVAGTPAAFYANRTNTWIQFTVPDVGEGSKTVHVYNVQNQKSNGVQLTTMRAGYPRASEIDSTRFYPYTGADNNSIRIEGRDLLCFIYDVRTTTGKEIEKLSNVPVPYSVALISNGQERVTKPLSIYSSGKLQFTIAISEMNTLVGQFDAATVYMRIKDTSGNASGIGDKPNQAIRLVRPVVITGEDLVIDSASVRVSKLSVGRTGSDSDRTISVSMKVKKKTGGSYYITAYDNANNPIAKVGPVSVGTDTAGAWRDGAISIVVPAAGNNVANYSFTLRVEKA